MVPGQWVIGCFFAWGAVGPVVQGHPRLGQNSLVPRPIVRFGTRISSRVVAAVARGSRNAGRARSHGSLQPALVGLGEDDEVRIFPDSCNSHPDQLTLCIREARKEMSLACVQAFSRTSWP